MKKIIGITLSLSFILSNCVRDEKIDDFPLEKSKIVVNSFLKNDEPIDFFISKSLSSIDNAKIKKVDNAEIKIYENDILVDQIHNVSPTLYPLEGYYLSSIKPQIGNHYKISVSAPNLNTITAESDLPSELTNVTAKLISLDTTILTNGYIFNDDSTQYQITIKEGLLILSIPDQPNVKNYYKITLKAEEKYWDGSNWAYRYNTMHMEDEEGNFENYNNSLFLDDKIYDGKNIPVSLQIRYSYLRTADPKIKFKIIISSQSEEKHKYDISLGQYYQNQENPFVEPTLVYSNILGGYGIFASESEFEIILEP